MKRKFNYNIIVFVLIAAFIVGGWCSGDMIKGTANAVTALIKNPSPGPFIDSIDTASKKYSWRYFSVDLHSLLYLITDTRAMEKDRESVIRMDNNYLDLDMDAFSDADIEKRAEACAKLNEFCLGQGIPFMYMYAPTKAYFGEYPVGFENTDKAEGDRFVSLLRSKGVNTLSFAELMLKQNKTLDEAYLKTDHHWTPETAFWANGEILKRLNKDYGFRFDEKTIDIKNYNVKIYKNFLGSQGKISGRFFSPVGLDDVSMITPKFKTSLTAIDSERTVKGSFEEALIDKSMLEYKTVHKSNHYSMYTGANFGELLVKNDNSPNDAKILLIRDSYAWPVIPFFVLNAKETQMLDLRETRPMESILEYIKQNDYDYVLILYAALESDEAYRFEPKQ